MRNIGGASKPMNVSTKQQRIAQVKRNREFEEPDVGNPLVRICGGAGQATARLYPDGANKLKRGGP